MVYTRADLELIERQIIRGEGHACVQRRIVSKLADGGAPNDLLELARHLLVDFEEALAKQHRRRDEIEKLLHLQSKPVWPSTTNMGRSLDLASLGSRPASTPPAG